jgi:chromosome segregation ATPase
VIRWFRDHVATVAAWLGMAATLLVGGAAQWTMAQAHMESARTSIADLETESRQHRRDIVDIRSDVRSVTEQQSRLESVVTRQEATVRTLETLTAELGAIVRTARD